jgi:hypothetical protein
MASACSKVQTAVHAAYIDVSKLRLKLDKDAVHRVYADTVYILTILLPTD